MIEQTIDVKILSADLKMMLAADEGEAFAHLQQQVPHARDEGAFEVTTPGDLSKAEKTEKVGSFKTCWARSEFASGKARLKFVMACP